MTKPIYTDETWTHDTLNQLWDAIDKIATEKYGLDYDQPQIEIITPKQMVGRMASHGLPVLYSHWSVGKQSYALEEYHKKNMLNAALEMIINSKPPIVYLCDTNNATTQATVLAHAVCGHASLFNINYIFQEYGQPDLILSYMKYAKRYIQECEHLYGETAVERTLDAAHALKSWGVDKYPRRYKKKGEEEDRLKRWAQYEQESFNEVFDLTIAERNKEAKQSYKTDTRRFPEENILYFIEKYSPILEPWQRELIRIVRKYYTWVYPMLKTKLLHEGWSTFWEKQLMTDLHDEGYITTGAYLEFLRLYTACNRQVDHHEMQPYALGGYMFEELKRICEDPTEEDKELFPQIAGSDWLTTFKDIGENYNDEDFILQFVTPRVIEKFNLYVVIDDTTEQHYTITHIQDKGELDEIRKELAKQYSVTHRVPTIRVVDYDEGGDRMLTLEHEILDNILIDEDERKETLKYVFKLWGHPVKFQSVDCHGAIVDQQTRRHS